MKHQLRYELQHGTDFVGRTFRRVIVSCIDGEDDVVFRSIGSIEIMTANRETLQSDSKHLSFDAVLHHWLFFRKNLIKRIFQVMTVKEVVDALVFATIVYP